MRYVTGLLVMVLLMLLDLLVLLSCLAIVGLFVILDSDSYPWSWSFAKGLWLRG